MNAGWKSSPRPLRSLPQPLHVGLAPRSAPMHYPPSSPPACRRAFELAMLLTWNSLPSAGPVLHS